METRMVTLTIDNKRITCAEDTTVLQAALDNGVYIPHLCSHESLRPTGACRMCMVRIDGTDGVVASCTTKVRDGMVVDTKDELAEKIRKLSCDLIFKTHPSECVGCPKYGKCQLQSISQYVGDTGRALRPCPIRVAENSENPIILHEMYRCILCGRCVRACGDMRGVGAIKFEKVNGRLQVVVNGDSLDHAGCRFCTACVEVCPTGSIREHEAIREKVLGNTRELQLVPCRAGCPAHIDVPKYLRFIRAGDYGAATAVVREKAPLPHALGFVCTHPCELECKRHYLNAPISIRNLKRYAVEHDDGAWRERSVAKPATGKRVAVVGAGPAGLTAAYYLKKQGHAVTIFEKEEKAGGQMRYGIPRHRLPREVVDAEVKDILAAGVKLETRTVASAAALKEEYDAVFVAVGTHKGVKLPIPGNDLPGVLVNADFLHDAEEGTASVGKTVMVLGGGNVALDCAGVAKRLGAQTVHVSCLESYETMPASKEELTWAEEEGVVLHPGYTFLRIEGETAVTGMTMQKINGFHFTADGKSVIDAVPDAIETIPCDTVVFAIGQRPDITDAFGLPLNRGRIVVDADGQTGVPGVFAAGDAVTGTQSIIAAIASTRAAVVSIDKYLGGDGDIEETLAPEQPRDPVLGKEDGFGTLPRREADVLAPDVRCHCFDQMDLGLSDENAQAEAARCLQCDLRLDIKPQRFWGDYTEGGADA